MIIIFYYAISNTFLVKAPPVKTVFYIQSDGLHCNCEGDGYYKALYVRTKPTTATHIIRVFDETKTSGQAMVNLAKKFSLNGVMNPQDAFI